MRDAKTGKFERVTGSPQQIDEALKTDNVEDADGFSKISAFSNVLETTRHDHRWVHVELWTY